MFIAAAFAGFGRNRLAAVVFALAKMEALLVLPHPHDSIK
jgi:hypothetical protein